MAETIVALTNNIAAGDWVKMSGIGFDIYGKVTQRNPQDGEMQIVTSSVVNGLNKPQKPSCEMNITKIDMKEVPKRSRMWILNRISNPPDPSKEVQAPIPTPD